MLTFLTSLLSPRPASAEVLGMRLTRTTCAALLDLCSAFQAQLRTQVRKIQELLDLQGFQAVVALLADIQERHAQIKQQLDDVVHRVQDSRAEWRDEFADARTAMEGKIRLCNLASTPFTMGWKAAAKKYWPLIAENYEMLLGLLERVQGELQEAVQGDVLWSGEGQRQMQGVSILRSVGLIAPVESRHLKTTTFSKRVAVRSVAKGEPAAEGEVDAAPSPASYKDTTVSLTDDRKDTARKYKSKKP